MRQENESCSCAPGTPSACIPSYRHRSIIDFVRYLFRHAAKWTPLEDLRFCVKIGLGLARIRGMRRSLTDDEQDTIAKEIVEHLEFVQLENRARVSPRWPRSRSHAKAMILPREYTWTICIIRANAKCIEIPGAKFDDGTRLALGCTVARSYTINSEQPVHSISAYASTSNCLSQFTILFGDASRSSRLRLEPRVFVRYT